MWSCYQNIMLLISITSQDYQWNNSKSEDWLFSLSPRPRGATISLLGMGQGFQPKQCPKGSLIYGDEINSKTTKGVWGGRGEPIALYDSLHKHLATWIFLKYLALQNVICLRRQDWMCPACVAGVSALASVTKDYGGSDGNLGRGREEGKNVLEMA